MVIPWGAIINALAIMIGGVTGLMFGTRLPERVRAIVFQGLGLCIMMIGAQLALTTGNHLVLIFSILLGGITGSLLNLEDRFARGGDRLKLCLRSRNPRFSEGLVSATVLFCIGAMAIVGSFDEGLRGDRSILYTKSILDLFAAMAMASVFGGGVVFSGFFVFLYQGLLTVFAASLQNVISPAAMTELTATGGILILGIGINLLNLTRIPLANMLPALLLAAPIAGWAG